MISKTEFLAASAANPKNKIFKFFQLFFKREGNNTVYTVYVSVLFVLFIIMFGYGIAIPNLGYFSTWPLLLKVVSTLFSFLVISVVSGSFIFGILDQKRIKKICSLLKISLFEYDELYNKYKKDLK